MTAVRQPTAAPVSPESAPQIEPVLAPADLVDQLGQIKAQISSLKDSEEEMKAKLVAYAHVHKLASIDGAAYRAAISEKTREGRDDIYKAAIEKLVEEHLSIQFQTAHRTESKWTEVRVSARKSGSRS